MKLLEEKILTEGKVLPGNILKVDGFLNQQIDIELCNEMGKEFARLFEGISVTKILTVEASGIAPACIAAQYFGNVPVIFGKKHSTLNQDTNAYTVPIFSFTHNTSYNVSVPKRFLSQDDSVLIIDDFLANGEACLGMMEIIKQAGAKCAGIGIIVEKGFQHGGDKLRESGIKVESLAIIESMDDCEIKFRS